MISENSQTKIQKPCLVQKKKNEETSNQIMLYTHYTLKKLNLKIKILTAEQVTQFCENNNYSLSVKLFCMSVKDYRVTYIIREVTKVTRNISTRLVSGLNKVEISEQQK